MGTGDQGEPVGHCVRRSEEHADDACPLVCPCRLPLSTHTETSVGDQLIDESVASPGTASSFLPVAPGYRGLRILPMPSGADLL